MFDNSFRSCTVSTSLIRAFLYQLYFRLPVANMDANNNQARTPHQEEEASIDILSKSSEENSQISSMAKSQEDVTQEIRISKRRSVYLFNSFSV